MATTNILKQIRALMVHATYVKEPIQALIVTNHDSHMSEYLEASDKRLQYVSGFSGSAGTAIITNSEALLWTDGRYFVQAAEQLDSNWKLMKHGLPSTPSEAAWLNTNLSPSSRIGVDPKLLPYTTWLDWEKELSKKGHTLVPLVGNIIDATWKERPSFSPKPIVKHDLKFTGVSMADKIKEVQSKMNEKDVDVLIINALDEIAWLLNLRGNDIQHCPVFFSYLILMSQNVHLFVDKSMLPSGIQNDFSNSETPIVLHQYSEFYNFIETEIVPRLSSIRKVCIPRNMNYCVYSLFPANKCVCECSPIQLMKALKNETEIQGMINAHIRDATALCRFYAWLETEVHNGVTEISAAEKLETFRVEEEFYMGPSFPTISSTGPHSAVIHYQPSEKTDRKLSCDEMYLCDSGAQFQDGTTDVTRTFHFGTPTDFEKECFTRVFKGQTALATAIFPFKLKGNYLDSIPRRPLWDVGLDYRHGTSHGVGSYLHVHEGPVGISWRAYPDDPGLQPNMILSNEPGYYHDGSFGIRLENIVQVIPATTAHNFQSTGFLTFRTLTLVPVQLKMLQAELLTKKEIEYLNDYHQTCREVIGPILKKRGFDEAYNWLVKETQILG